MTTSNFIVGTMPRGERHARLHAKAAAENRLGKTPASGGQPLITKSKREGLLIERRDRERE
jgi:hypothetical protein